MTDNDLLILRDVDVSKRIESLLASLSKSDSFQRSFVESPVETIAATVFPEREISAGDVDEGSRLLVSLLKNERFREWIRQFEIEQLKPAVQFAEDRESQEVDPGRDSRQELYRDLVAGVQRYGDEIGLLSPTSDTTNQVFGDTQQDVTDKAAARFARFSTVSPSSAFAASPTSNGPGAAVTKVEGASTCTPAAVSRAVLNRIANFLAAEARRQHEDQQSTTHSPTSGTER